MAGLGQPQPTGTQLAYGAAGTIGASLLSPLQRLTAPSAAKTVGTTVGSSLMTAAAVAGPAAPFLLAGGALIDVFSSIIGPDPRNVPDTQVIEAAQISLNQLWLAISGEQLPINCVPGRCGAQRVNIFQSSAYPNVPKGAAGDLAIDINQAIAQANQVITQARSMLLKPASAQNPFFAPGGGNNIVGLLQRMAAARAAQAGTTAGVSGARGLSLPGLLTGGAFSISPALLVGLLAAVLAFAWE